MKFTLSWLKDHLETAADLDTMSRTLTALGLEVDSITDRGTALAPFVVARIVSAEKHPDADRLQVCRVDTGSGIVQVVCGAPNARAGLVGVFAPTGTVIPGTGDLLKAGVIRGVASNGMLCSEREMGLSDEHHGIIELPEATPIGVPFASVVGADDPVIEIGLTPDRADCAGVRGIARDLAAAGLGSLKPVAAPPVAATFTSATGVRFDLPDPAACPLFLGRQIRGVTNGPSPRWLRDRLTAIGLRPISALVDITNYLTFDQARPLHVFDRARLDGDLVVRFARPGETLKALNGKEYRLDDGMTVIADATAIQSLGGVIGGEASGCSEATTDVFVECALFDPIRTATTGRKLMVDSDARYRFERGVDPGAIGEGIEAATRLIVALCGGEAGSVVVTGAPPAWQRTLSLRPDRVLSLGGVDVARAEQVRILNALGFTIIEEGSGPAGSITVAVPSWRGDVQGEADLVEEVLRVWGYDAIPSVPLTRPTALTRPAVTPSQRRADFVRRTLAARGLDEAVTWSFMAAERAALLGPVDPELRLVNPISADLDVMRPSILGNLLAAAGRNADRGIPDLGLFEIGPAYRNATPTGQDLVACGVRTGAAIPRHWAVANRVVDTFDAKADALAALEAAGGPSANVQISADAPDRYHPGRSGSLRLGATVLGWFGEIHPSLRLALGLKGVVVGFEILLNAVPQPRKKPGTAKPALTLSAFQPVSRDFAFVVDRGVDADRLIRAARGADKSLIRDVALFDVYQGPGVAEGRKSLAIAVTLQPADKVLTDADLEAVSGRIVAAVIKATGATLRT
ncbi:MAG: phenylalanine--tRNA ligase subunit beta [Azospirillaceae bacterium]|nr:phenylalanine--tRNA ligase subunit beta [Azospirillaceae bacterium]